VARIDKWGLRGMRVNGGTSTGRSVRDLCHTSLDGPDVQAARRHDAELQPVQDRGKRTSEAPPPTRFCPNKPGQMFS
jgi:hypothetical protein